MVGVLNWEHVKMAEKAPRKKRIRKVETVRERAEKAQKSVDKPKRIRSTATKATKPFKLIWLGLVTVLRPFRFVLKPFKTRPARFIGRILANVLFLGYVRNSWKEVKQVTWPSRKETLRLSLAVFVFAFVFGVTIAITDYGLDQVFKRILLQ